MTRGGIETDLKITPFTYTYEIENDSYVFAFSSLLYMTKFSEQIEHCINEFNEKMTYKYFIKFDFSILPLIGLYKEIEKRGFYITKNGVIIKWLDEIKIKEKITL